MLKKAQSAIKAEMLEKMLGINKIKLIDIWPWLGCIEGFINSRERAQINVEPAFEERMRTASKMKLIFHSLHA